MTQKKDNYKSRISQITDNGNRAPTSAEISSVFNDFPDVFQHYGGFHNPNANLEYTNNALTDN